MNLSFVMLHTISPKPKNTLEGWGLGGARVGEEEPKIFKEPKT